MEPGQGALDHPSNPAQLLGGLDSASSDARLDMSDAADNPAPPVVVGLVGVKFRRATTRTAALLPDGADGVDDPVDVDGVVVVGWCQQRTRQGNAVPVDDNVVL